MTAYTIQSGTYDGLYQFRDLPQRQFSRTIDWSKLANGTTAGVNTDTADVIDIPAGFVATDTSVKIIQCCTTTSYFTVSPFLTTSIDAKSTAGALTAVVATSVALMNPIAYASATAVKVTLSTPAPHNGKALITICGYQMPVAQ